MKQNNNVGEFCQRDEIQREALVSDFVKVFERHRNDKVNPVYEDRASRNVFAANRLREAEVHQILNIGGGGARHLQGSLSPAKVSVFEVDIQGDCDLKVNLDSLSRLPFSDGEYEVACAFDVLEHLENFHLMNEELLRVARRFVLISLPNSPTEIARNLRPAKPDAARDPSQGALSKYYGIPLRRPEDRHRWWMYFNDVIRYYYYIAKVKNLELEFWTPRLNIKKRLFRSVFGGHMYYNFFCPVIWIKLSKGGYKP